jgi:ketosteroid isomerase-like protein
MSKESVELVHALYDAFARRDMPAALATLADDIEWHETGSRYAGEVWRGHDAIIQQVFGPSINDIENLAVTPEQTFDADDTIAVIHRYTGTVKATGKPLDVPGIGIWHVHDRKILAYHQYSDRDKWDQAFSPRESPSP